MNDPTLIVELGKLGQTLLQDDKFITGKLMMPPAVDAALTYLGYAVAKNLTAEVTQRLHENIIEDRRVHIEIAIYGEGEATQAEPEKPSTGQYL